MVRINLINPRALADQHLIAEYNEILKFLGHVRKFPIVYEMPREYCLGKGHINFFKNKLKYINKRFEEVSKEMKRRNFKVNKNINLDMFHKELINDWEPCKNDFCIIKKRLITKINLKPDYYRYERKKENKEFFIDLIKRN